MCLTEGLYPEYTEENPTNPYKQLMFLKWAKILYVENHEKWS